jgi:hypothetical protein
MIGFADPVEIVRGTRPAEVPQSHQLHVPMERRRFELGLERRFERRADGLS